MDEQKLTVFLQVARQLSFSRAAELLHLSQPAVSQQVAALEAELGVRLLDRSSRSVSITDSGQMVMEYAERVLRDCQELRRRIDDTTGSPRVPLAIASSLTVANYVLPPTLARLKARLPAVISTVTVANTEHVVTALRAGEIDLGLVEGNLDASGLVVQRFRHDELVVVAPVGHRWADVAEIELDDFRQEPLIVREQGSGTRQVAERYLRGAGVEPDDVNIVAEISDIEATKGAVESGLGVAVLSLSSLRKELRLGTVVVRPLRGLSMLRDMSTVSVEGRPLTAPAAELVRMLDAEGA